MTDHIEPKDFTSPHIIFVLLDDVGWNDIAYNTNDSPMVTPVMDSLANTGVQLNQHYMHSLCSPSRAALMTGRYHVNTEITFVIPPPSPAGLPTDMATLPELLRDHANYSTSIVGKWHLGHTQLKQTPTARGFDTFSGMYSFVPDHYTKQVHQVPWGEPSFIDWVHQNKDGSLQFVAEARHSTQAITEDAEDVIRSHATSAQQDQPLFLYVAFTGVHAPLTPMPGHEKHCIHVPQIWRRDFCGLLYGVDEGIGNITRTATSVLGDNVLLVVASDNGGSPWFGGNNMPLRGSKITPYEGGVKVPAFVVDLSADQHILSNHHQATTTTHPTPTRVMTELMHVSDWLPTLTSLAGIDQSLLPMDLDGIDMSQALKAARLLSDAERANRSLLFDQVSYNYREEMLLEMYYPGDVSFNDTLVAYRIRDMKLIHGIVRDDNYYYEPTNNWMAMTRPTWLSRIVEVASHVSEYCFGVAASDLFRVGLTHVTLQDTFTTPQRTLPSTAAPTPAAAAADLSSVMLPSRLYNITADPFETQNLFTHSNDQNIGAVDLADWFKKITERIQHYRTHRPKPQPCHKILLADVWQPAAIRSAQHCHANNSRVQEQHCRFLSPYISDTVTDLFAHLQADLVERKTHDFVSSTRAMKTFLHDRCQLTFVTDTQAAQLVTYRSYLYVSIVIVVVYRCVRALFVNCFSWHDKQENISAKQKKH